MKTPHNTKEDGLILELMIHFGLTSWGLDHKAVPKVREALKAWRRDSILKKLPEKKNEQNSDDYMWNLGYDAAIDDIRHSISGGK